MDEFVIQQYNLNQETISILEKYTDNPINFFEIYFYDSNNSIVDTSSINFYRLCNDYNQPTNNTFSFQNSFSNLQSIENGTSVSASIFVYLNDGSKYQLLSFNVSNINFQYYTIFVINFTAKLQFVQPCEQVVQQQSSSQSTQPVTNNITNTYVTNIYKTIFQTRNSILLPYYEYPSVSQTEFTSDTYKLLEAIRSSNINFYIIVNPNNGPGTSTDQNYQNFIDNIVGANGIPIGYVYTSYGKRSITDIINDVETWTKLYKGIRGIFFDQITTSITRDQVKQLSEAVRKNNMDFVILNPGTNISYELFSEILDYVDIVVTYENNTLSDLDLNQGIYQKIEKTKKACLLNSFSSIDENTVDNLLNYFSYIYIANTYSSLPNYFEEEVYYVERNSHVYIGNEEPKLERYKLWYNTKNSTLYVNVNNKWIEVITQSSSNSATSVSVDNISITYNSNDQLEVKDQGITVNKLSNNIDASTIGFNAYSVDGYVVNNNASPSREEALWTNKKISKDSIVKAIIFG